MTEQLTLSRLSGMLETNNLKDVLSPQADGILLAIYSRGEICTFELIQMLNANGRKRELLPSSVSVLTKVFQDNGIKIVHTPTPPDSILPPYNKPFSFPDQKQHRGGASAYKPKRTGCRSNGNPCS